ncbi:TetR/AcrR family transcriptional regulator [Virgibacillus sp. 179-BFC.A HS]|uniref:TetR/AcrR family transcriptional regulator n=1 Tax=Tigheibacillus jepli TaxID=3035914 RepID=A0ABU5CHH1_9BACI|nr:TetR/AcrR family transcriptional regulator [Virgibacillus sp. 179-BFC.A HS]MDY0405774.1 TetR/AcrR family transcriptional regulator [Virgibacillus sp. 179-BFC.A HS]
MTADLREKIIEHALKLFEAHGFHGVSVNQIVESVGTSKGGFYHHFKSKDELLFVIHDTFITYVIENATLAEERFESASKKLQAIILNFVKVFDLYKAHISVFYQEELYLKPEYDVLIKEKRDHFKRIIYNTIRDGKQSGEMREDLSVEITTMAVLGMVNWTYKWYKKDGSKSIDEIAYIFTDLILRSILKENLLAEEKYKEILLEDIII